MVAQQNPTEFDLSLLEQYYKLTEVEGAIKEEKKVLKKKIMGYMSEFGLKVTPPYKNLIATLEEKKTYSLNHFMLQLGLPNKTYREIINVEIDIEKVRKAFLDNRIPIRLLREAEISTERNYFYVRKATREVGEERPAPFWR